LNGWVGWGPESTWGTAVARNKFAELAGAESMKLLTNPTKPRSFRGLSPRRVFEGKRMVEGEIPLELHYAGFEQLFKQLFGTVNTTGPVGGIYTHAYALATALLAGITVEINRDITSFIYEGCKVASMRFVGEVDQILMVALSLIGEDETTGAASSPTFPAENPILFSQATVKLDGSAFDCVSFEVNISNNLNGDRRKLGSKLIKEPSRNGLMEITGSAVLEFESTTMYDKYRNRTDVKLNFIFDGAASEQLDLELPRCFLTGNTPNIPGPGPIQIPINFEAMYNVAGAAEAAKLTLKNTTSSVT
jgi:hypothetical protein